MPSAFCSVHVNPSTSLTGTQVMSRSEVRFFLPTAIQPNRRPAGLPTNIFRLRAAFRLKRALFQWKQLTMRLGRAYHGVHGEGTDGRSGMSRAWSESCDLVAC